MINKDTKIKYSLSVVLPVYNEEENINEVIVSIIDFLRNNDSISEFEIIAVDDGSTDNTMLVLESVCKENDCCKIVKHVKNLGYGKTIISGMKKTIYPLVLFMDADGQFKIASFNNMLEYISEYDIIIGYRALRKDGLHRRILGNIFTFLVNCLFDLKIKDVNCGFKLYKKEVFNNEYNFHAGVFYTEVFVKAIKDGFRIKQIPVEHYPRLKGRQSGASLKVIFIAIIDMIRLIGLKIGYKVRK